VKILILKPSSLGDVVHALPVLRLLKRHRPESRVCWWIDSDLLPLLAGDPDLEALIPFHRRRWGHPRHWHELWNSIRHLRAWHFDWVIDLQSLARSSIVAWLANGRLTVGLDDPREGACALYDIAVRRPSFHTHAVDWYLRVLTALEVPIDRPFDWLPERPAAAAAIRNRWPDDAHPWIALQPGARWDNKRWPAAFFAEVVQELSPHFPRGRFAILGGASDRPLASEIAAAAPGRCLDLTGQTSLPEMIEWLRRASLLLTNDSGPMHVAAALGKPVVALFGPTEPRRTGPYRQTNHVLQNRQLPCVPCLQRVCRHSVPLECLRTLSPHAVAQAVLERFAACSPSLHA